MIQAKDLRIGNKVSDRNGFEMDVVAIFENNVVLNFKGNEGDVWEFEGKEIHPIEITDEIINTWWLNRKDRKTDDLVLSVGMTGGKKHIVLNDNYYIKCDYLHELQNVYYTLTGKELKFKKAKKC